MASIAIGSDSAAFELKDVLVRHLPDGGYEVKDFGTDPDEPPRRWRTSTAATTP